MYMDQSMNVLFLVDIILNFFTAFFDEDYMIVNDIKVRRFCLSHFGD